MRQNLTLSGRYRLNALIGRGGMGEVWRATDLRLGRSVAVKLLHVERVGDPHAMRRFEREATAAAALRHRGITVVFDTGVDDESGLAFFVMELLDGENLQRLLDRSPGGLPPERVREYGAQIASALAEAHEQGVVHRDIKPANVILLPGEELKICDFGVARFAAQSGSLTRGAVGTPLYMAPEQLRGGAVDGRADLYSFGCLLYALASGRPPFTADGLPALMYQHMSVTPQPLTDLRPGFPADLAGLIMQCLAKNPEDRPRSARAVDEALRHTGIAGTRPSAPWTPGGPVQGATLPAGRPRPWPKIALAAAAALLAITVSAVAFAYVQGNGDNARTGTPSASAPRSGSPSATASMPVTTSRPALVPHGWIQHRPADHQATTCPSANSGYRLPVDGKAGYVEFCEITVSQFGDVAIDTTVTLTGSQCASLVARRSGPLAYEFVVCGTGRSITRKWSGDDDLEVLQETPGKGPLHGRVHLTALAIGDTLSLYVNGELTNRPRDGEIRAGGVGLGSSVLNDSPKGTLPITDLTIWCAPGFAACT